MLLCLKKTFGICLSLDHLVHSVIPLGWATTVKLENFSMQVSQIDAVISAILAWKLFILAWNQSLPLLESSLICCSSKQCPLSCLVSLSLFERSLNCWSSKRCSLSWLVSLSLLERSLIRWSSKWRLLSWLVSLSSWKIPHLLIIQTPVRKEDVLWMISEWGIFQGERETSQESLEQSHALSDACSTAVSLLRQRASLSLFFSKASLFSLEMLLWHDALRNALYNNGALLHEH